jgi:hypothetical protein
VAGLPIDAILTEGRFCAAAVPVAKAITVANMAVVLFWFMALLVPEVCHSPIGLHNLSTTAHVGAVTTITFALNFATLGRIRRDVRFMVNDCLTTKCLNCRPSEQKARIVDGHFLLMRSAACSGTRGENGRRARGLMAVTAASAALVLNACQSPLPFYEARVQEPSGKIALHARHVRSPKAAASDDMNSRQAYVGRPTAHSVHTRGWDGFEGISPEDEGLTGDPPGGPGRIRSREFESAVVGSDQWYRERAEDQAREMELRRKLRICAC